jgi:LacI family gluconate utilization system Gnt-I transcriptional repressor
MTVTRVFIRPDQVLPATRARVEQAVAQLGYVPDRAAGSLATRRSGFVGLVLPTLVNGNFAAIAEGLILALRPAGYELLIGYTTYSIGEEERQLRTMLARRPEALVLAAAPHSPQAQRLLAHAGAPVLQIADLPEAPAGASIGFSNLAVGRAAGAFLIGLGHRRIAALGPARESDRIDIRAEARLQGFTEALREADLPTHWVRTDGRIPLSYREGARTMAGLLEAAPNIEAVFATSDLTAVGAFFECRRRNIAVPQQISLLGFGDFEIGQQMVPALSTIAVDFAGLGQAAGEQVVALLRHGPAGPDRIDVGFTVTPRATTRAAFA